MISHQVARSVLYTPAINVSGYDKAAQVGADVAVFDLEDSVPPAMKAHARELACEWPGGDRSCISALRINSLPTLARVHRAQI